MKIIETERLSLRLFTHGDAPFILKLLNQPGWLRFIGDRGINNEEDARSYIETKLIAAYRKYGYGLYAVELKGEDAVIGMCGLVKRDWLDDVDIGFAMFSCYEGHGYATEAAQAVLNHAHDTHGLWRILGITTGDNNRSIRLLNKIGMKYEKSIKDPGDESILELYSIESGDRHEYQ